ncbi:M48 family metalloprotease [Aestuariibaculum lutulentum]|uniref:M48 family metalloprotease n=1 Tax=Aestuariibaculum lutulentum TaxID=2920935 RepID=A0ABS9RJP7_9FLAO|nr:M48 family metalloprotease [Aestuariibaculum lutulentum]MCH4553173.1 M48 family metalloprotease [Aestuariibaculum lutulentum]
MVLRTFFICFLVFRVLVVQGQSNHYIPGNIDSLEIYLKKINTIQIQNIDGEYASKIKKIFKDRNEFVLEVIKDSTYYFNPELKKGIDEILKEIYVSNSQIDFSNYYFFIKNSIMPNAACYGDGMFEINLGLITVLESEDELAFTLCHEIAHKLLDHSLKSINNRMDSVNSKETKERVKRIKREKYGQVRSALSVIDELNIDFLDYSKEVEAQADSLGFVLYSKTRYQPTHAISSLERLRKIDDMILHHNVDVDSVFNFKTYKFQSYWLKENTSIFDVEKPIDEFALVSDTLKTHPEIEFRINKLIKEFDVDNSDAKLIYTNPTFQDLKEIAQYQSIQFTLDLNFLDMSIYQLIEKRKNKKITSDYYNYKMAEAIKKLYEAKKNHVLGKYVPFKDKFSAEKQLNAIRLLLHNLELQEIEQIGFAFCNENRSQISGSKDFESICEFFKILNR